jgi:protein SCO1
LRFFSSITGCFSALRLQLAVATLLCTLLTVGCGKEAASFRASDVTGASFGRDFALIDHHGQARRLADFKGKVVVVFFGFTHCPDFCPTTLAELAAARRQLGGQADRVQVLLITVDPERDTPEVLSQYVTGFDPTFIGLTGTREQIAAVTREFKVVAQKVKGKTADSYSVDHSAGTYVFDPSGVLRLYVSYGQGADVFVHDIGELLKRG